MDQEKKKTRSGFHHRHHSPFSSSKSKPSKKIPKQQEKRGKKITAIISKLRRSRNRPFSLPWPENQDLSQPLSTGVRMQALLEFLRWWVFGMPDGELGFGNACFLAFVNVGISKCQEFL
eukprot:TRINITY_DN10642_c1_g1_i2.p1 TRINITY_DN10642_c1_g1~~TRINITY_DN10642_c1_g1_i2.p1  ORF type:complete len:119 (-),score=21.21 TRINITY_DN10642_c1_g1_i2:246-602(-)